MSEINNTIEPKSLQKEIEDLKISLLQKYNKKENVIVKYEYCSCCYGKGFVLGRVCPICKGSGYKFIKEG